MNDSIQGLNLGALSPAEKMELADALYDTAVQEMEALMSPLTDEQMREVEQRIAEADAGNANAEPWEHVYEQLRHHCR